jgi:hypothetical protein
MTKENYETVVKILAKMRDKKISKKKLGEILGSRGGDRSKIQMVDRFLKQLEKGEETRRDCEKIAEVLGQDVFVQSFGDGNKSVIQTGDGNTINISGLDFDSKRIIHDMVKKLQK